MTLIVTLSIPKSVSLCQWQLLWLTIADNNCQLPDYFLVIPLITKPTYLIRTTASALLALKIKSQIAIIYHLAA